MSNTPGRCTTEVNKTYVSLVLLTRTTYNYIYRTCLLKSAFYGLVGLILYVHSSGEEISWGTET